MPVVRDDGIIVCGEPPGGGGGGGGDVVGPASATDNAVARYDGITGKLIQNSLVTIDDVGTLRAPEVQTGDLLMHSHDGTAKWRLVEKPDGIHAINEITGRRLMFVMIELDDDP